MWSSLLHFDQVMLTKHVNQNAIGKGFLINIIGGKDNIVKQKVHKVVYPNTKSSWVKINEMVSTLLRKNFNEIFKNSCLH